MLAIDGPQGPIPFERDAWGYPRIRARELLEGAFARGWFHAVDRLVQVQLAQAVARGDMMALLGDVPMARTVDQAVRMFQLAGDAEAQVARLDAPTRAFVEAYCAGFEAGVAKRGWPLVLRLLGIPRAPFTPACAVLAYRLVGWFGLTSLQQSAETIVGELVASKAPRRAIDLLAGPFSGGLDERALAELKWPQALAFAGPAFGSNAFAVAGRRSKTGGALLMGEPHLEVARIPPVLYACHVDFPDGEYYQGVGIPGIPWLSFARTRNVAVSYTYAHGDCVDVLVERCKEGRFLEEGGWRPLRRRVERVRIKGKKQPEEWTFWDNDYGTIAGDASGEADLPCFRWSGLAETWSDFSSVLPMLRARTVAELAESQRLVKCLSLHAVMADSTGAVGRLTTGQIDVRPAGWTGAVPWAGWQVAGRTPAPLGEDTRPADLAPVEGFIASANESRDPRWCSFPEPRYRHERLTELLGGAGTLGLNDLAAASYDPVDLCAKRLLALWAPYLPAEAAPLCAWAAAQPNGGGDHFDNMGRFHALHREVLVELLGRLIGPARSLRIFGSLGGDVIFQHHLDGALALERPDLLDATELADVLACAWPRAQSSRLPVRARFTNALTQGKIPLLGLDSAPITFPGGPTTTFQTRSMDFLGQRLVAGPACHLLIDMSKPGAWYNIAGGASERRFGPGYKAGITEWSTGHFRPLGDATGEPPAIV